MLQISEYRGRCKILYSISDIIIKELLKIPSKTAETKSLLIGVIIADMIPLLSLLLL
jgi:hypothetical protein